MDDHMNDHRVEQAISLAKRTVARLKEVDPAAITVAAVEEQEWPSTALGCPQPDGFYAQMLVPGYRILLVGPDGERWTVHTDEGSRATLCEETES